MPLHIIANLTRASIPNTYDINFSSNINKTDITLNDLLVTVSSKYSIKFTWTATYINDKTLRVSIITNFVLVGDEIVTIKFISYKIFRGPYGGWLSIDSVTSIANNNLVDSEQTVLSMSALLQYSTYTGILVTVVLIILGGGSMEIFWALLSSMQLITFLPLMTPYFPGHVRIMFEMLKFSNMNFDFMSNAFTALLPFDFRNIAAYSEVFTENGVGTPLFLKNWASILLSLILYIGLYILSLIISKIVWYEKIRNKFKIIASSFIFNNFLRFMIQGYLMITFGCILNVYSLRFGKTVEMSSFITSSLFLVIFVLYPFMMFALIYDNRKDLITNENYVNKYGTLFKHLKNDGCWYTLQFYPIFLVRRLIFVSLLIILEGIPEAQCNIFIFSSLCVS